MVRETLHTFLLCWKTEEKGLIWGKSTRVRGTDVRMGSLLRTERTGPKRQ